MCKSYYFSAICRGCLPVWRCKNSKIVIFYYTFPEKCFFTDFICGEWGRGFAPSLSAIRPLKLLIGTIGHFLFATKGCGE